MGNAKSCLPCVAKPFEDKIPIKKSETADIATINIVDTNTNILVTSNISDSPREKENEF